MRILVTGGAGYIGSTTARLLRDRGHHVVILDSLELGYRQSAEEIPLVVGNTRDTALVAQLLRDEKLEAVVHFAAYKAAGESMEQPGRYFDNNVTGTLGLLEGMRAASVRHLVFSSTCAVYGTPKNLPVSEANTPVGPESPYGESKLMVEQMLRWYDVAHGLRSVALRYFNAAGASADARHGEDPSRALNLVPVVMKAATGRAPTVQVFGADYPTPDGTAIRDYIHVLDLAEAHLCALDFLRDHERSDVFGLGTGQGASVKQVLDIARAVSGVDIPVRYTERRPGDPVAIWADNRKARELLRWSPRFGLDEIVASAWRWQHAHPDGYATKT
jgi:UDP-glucose 4-epimerase